MVNPRDILFVGQGQAATAWYRCYMPAQALDMDYVGLSGEPPNMRWATGLVTVPDKDQKQSVMPNLLDYKIVVLQQPRGRAWLSAIRGLQKRGVKVVYEVDDYLHGIKNVRDHDFRAAFGPKQLPDFEMCMRVCDAVICSTRYIARRYRRFNSRTVVCENGLDLKRYDVTRPERETVNILWAGATGHTKAIAPWLYSVVEVMEERKNVCFVSIGQRFAEDKMFAGFDNRAIAVPWCAVEQYPAAMTLGDIALAPARRTLFHAGKSDLRWLEAGALGMPTIADPFVYDKVEDGVNGFTFDAEHENRDEYLVPLLLDLVDDAELRTTVGENARRYVREERSIEVAARQWMEVFESLSEDAATVDPGGTRER